MKFLHTGDWHIGKKLHGFQLLQEQQEVFQQLLDIAKKEEVEAIVIAGDLFDRSVPPAEAVSVLNQMFIDMNLTEKIPVLAISGNHDSATRLETGSEWFKQANLYLQTKINEFTFQPITLGNTQFFLLPYFDPIDARLYFSDDTLTTHEKAVERVVEKMKEQFEETKHQVLISHFFVTGSLRSESETGSTVGGLDNVSARVFQDFTYVALGHLHHPEALKSETVRYSGSLLKYSVSEADQQKGFRIIEIDDEGLLTQQFHPVQPSRDIIVLKEHFSTLTEEEFYLTIKRDQFIYIKLKDTVMLPNAMNRLREIYPYVIGMERVNQSGLLSGIHQTKKEVPTTLAPHKLFSHYFEELTENPLTKQQEQLIASLFEDLQKEVR
ncbi:MAG: exonuclease SbcCD subunit D [Desemzia incerta]